MDSDTQQKRDPVAARTHRLADNYRLWAGLPRVHHLLCILLLLAVPVLRWWPVLTDAAEPLGDEPAYRAAFAKIAAGESPYDGTEFLYPAVFAFAGAWSVEHIGLEATTYILRGANLLGLATVVWCSMAWLAWPISRRLWVGAAFIMLAPQVAYSVLLGNLSLAVAGLVIAALLLVPRAPLRAGLALGASLALKPVAPMALACLVGAVREEGRHARWVAAATAALVAAVLLGAFPYAGRLLHLSDTDRVAMTLSLHRFPKLLGFEIDALWISVPLALGALLLLRRVQLGNARFACFAITASLVVLPLVWSHTLVLALPLQALALWVAADRRRVAAVGLARPSRLPTWLEPTGVLLAVASLQFSAGSSAIDNQGLAIQWAGAILPALAPIGLLAYLLAHTKEF